MKFVDVKDENKFAEMILIEMVVKEEERLLNGKTCQI